MSFYDRPGRLAPRWIQDLIHQRDPEIFEVADANIIARLQAINPSLGGYPEDHVHTLIVIPSQSSQDLANPTRLSMVCRVCDFQFIVQTNRDPTCAHMMCNGGHALYTGSKSWPPDETSHLAHHIMFIGRWSQQQVDAAKSDKNPVLGMLQYDCSVSDCYFSFSLEILEPRLSLHWLSLLTDTERVKRKLEEAREAEPQRYSDSKDEWHDSGLSLLNTYLRHRLSNPDNRRISKRNKRFQVVFGAELWPLFTALGFTEETTDNDGVVEEYLMPQALEPVDPNSPTIMGSMRSFVETMQVEVENRIVAKSGSQDPSAGVDAVASLENLSHCRNYPTSGDSFAGVNADSIEFNSLGILPVMDKTLIIYAFRRQAETWPSQHKAHVDALIRVSTRLDDGDLQEVAATEISMQSSPPQQTKVDHAELWQAATFFRIENPTTVTDAVIVASFKTTAKDDKNIARRHLETLAKHRSSRRLQEALAGNMSVETALEILSPDNTENIGVANLDDSFVHFLASEALDKYSANLAMQYEVLEALSILGGHLQSDGLAQRAMNLSKGLPGAAQMLPAQELAIGSVRLDLPVGLKNIGNTCYLNSILQYLFTAKPVRDVAQNYPDFELTITDETISARRIGGNKMTIDRAEAIVAKAFAGELNDLFQKLRTAPWSYTQPTQRLANAVLISTDRIARVSKTESSPMPDLLDPQSSFPPPLPARPPVSTEHVEHVEKPGNVEQANNVKAVDTVSNHSSNGSSKTLVDDAMEVDAPHDVDHASDDSQLDQDVEMGGTADDIAAQDQNVLQALETQKRSSGTDQQDVEEVFGSIINRLQSAIKPDGEINGIQMEVMMNTFYIKMVHFTKTDDKASYRSETTFDRSITAYPAENGPCSIYEALSRNFDRQTVEESQIMRYSAISHLPPLLHVLVQRTKHTGEKNGNPVKVEDMLYLDRYMNDEKDSDLMKLRGLGWFLQKHLEIVSAAPPKPKNEDEQVPLDRYLVSEFSDADIQDDVPPSLLSDRPLSQLTSLSEPFHFQEYSTDTDIPDAVPTLLTVDDLPSPREIEEISKSKAERYTEALEQLFSERKKEAYRLHAVICHSGRLTAGHYWIWIHDFDAGVWRKYNDETVTEESDTTKVLEILNNSGEPYYLCYVRDEVKHEFVDVPKREPDSTLQMTDQITKDMTHGMTDEDSSTLPSIRSKLGDILEDQPFSAGRPNSPAIAPGEHLPAHDQGSA